MKKEEQKNILAYIVVYAAVSALMLLAALILNVTRIENWSSLPLIPSLKPVIIMLIGLLGVLGAYNYYKKRDRAYRMLLAFFVATSFGFAAFGIQFQSFTGFILGFEYANLSGLELMFNYSVQGELAEIPNQVVAFSFNLFHIFLTVLFVKFYSHEK